jgi:hypothetical protein
MLRHILLFSKQFYFFPNICYSNSRKLSAAEEGKMKIKTGRTVEKAVREFTDREAPRASFWKKYHAVEAELGKDANVHVLTYYGIGGIGKTSLVKKLMREMDQKLPSPVYVYLDFGISPDIRRNLSSLKCKLQENTKFTFPLLELGLYIYAKRWAKRQILPKSSS